MDSTIFIKANMAVNDDKSVKELVERDLGTQNVSNFMAELGNVGIRGHFLMRNDKEKNCFKRYHFLAAMVVSSTELRNNDYSGIRAFRKYLLKCKSASTVPLSKRYILYDRLVVISSPSDTEHCEARFFGGPKEDTSSKLSEKPVVQYDKQYLSSLKDNFVKVFGLEENAIILVFTYFSPCTSPGHMCCDLIGKFAASSSEPVMLGYQIMYSGTNRDVFNDTMANNNVYVIRTRSIQRPMTRPIKGTRRPIYRNRRTVFRKERILSPPTGTGNETFEDNVLYKHFDKIDRRKKVRQNKKSWRDVTGQRNYRTCKRYKNYHESSWRDDY